MQTDQQPTLPEPIGRSGRYLPPKGYMIVLYLPDGVVAVAHCREELAAAKARAERMARPYDVARFRVIDDNGRLACYSAG